MITKKQIFNVTPYLAPIAEGESFYVVKALNDVTHERLEKIGFSQLEMGSSILPAICGPKSRFNANGSYVIRKDLPKELCCREWYCKDWGGHWHTVYIDYERYHRDPIPAPEIEITIMEKDNHKYLVSPLLTNHVDSKEHIKHVLNLFLELFGNCELFKQTLEPIFPNIPITKLNWLILPPGEYPWERVKEGLKLANRKSLEIVKRNTYQVITQHHPESIGMGLAGFHGYIVYLFPQKSIALLEHMLNGNATYVFNTSSWEMFSQLSKSDIINNNLMIDRIIHKSDWERRITQLLNH